MELQHVNVKLYLENSEKLDLEPLIRVYHNWIQDRVCEELLIDVADYRHVFAGPRVVLIGHEADYSIDCADNRPGIRYNRKAILEGGNQDRFKQAMRAALTACKLLESDPRLAGKLLFNRREIEFFVNDRLLAPNLERTYTAVKPELQSFFQRLFENNEYSMQHISAPRRLFSVAVKASRLFDPDTLLGNLSRKVGELVQQIPDQGNCGN
jgi:hypothetical protein